MYCPLCASALETVERQGVEIDHCKECGGLWLDQGELDRLVRAEALAALTRGQQALSETRQDREFDRVTESNIYGLGHNFATAGSPLVEEGEFPLPLIVGSEFRKAGEEDLSPSPRPCSIL